MKESDRERWVLYCRVRGSEDTFCDREVMDDYFEAIVTHGRLHLFVSY